MLTAVKLFAIPVFRRPLADEERQALKIVKSYSSPSPDSVHLMILKELMPVIVPTLTALFSQSLTLARLPDE